MLLSNIKKFEEEELYFQQNWTSKSIPTPPKGYKILR